MKILDCETSNSTYRSLETILGIAQTDLEAIFDELSIEGYEDFDRQFFLKTNISLRSVTFDSVCWFHLTRVDSNTTFSEGILPLNLSIERIWNLLFQLVKSSRLSIEDWNAFKIEMTEGQISTAINLCSNSQSLYKMKVGNQIFGGPYAMLVREISFNSAYASNHDYLTIPEIIEDILRCFEHVFGYSLVDEYSWVTRPCIVKFQDLNHRNDLLQPALFYLFCERKGYKLSQACNNCFDGGGNTVPSESILSVTILD